VPIQRFRGYGTSGDLYESSALDKLDELLIISMRNSRDKESSIFKLAMLRVALTLVENCSLASIS
jgi:hypothetical protein